MDGLQTSISSLAKATTIQSNTASSSQESVLTISPPYQWLEPKFWSSGFVNIGMNERPAVLCKCDNGPLSECPFQDKVFRGTYKKPPELTEPVLHTNWHRREKLRMFLYAGMLESPGACKIRLLRPCPSYPSSRTSPPPWTTFTVEPNSTDGKQIGTDAGETSSESLGLDSLEPALRIEVPNRLSPTATSLPNSSASITSAQSYGQNGSIAGSEMCLSDLQSPVQFGRRNSYTSAAMSPYHASSELG